jgi:hypothetical protein
LDKDRNQQENNENEGTITKINDRIKSLDALLNSASYSKQKCNLIKEMENVLVLLDPLKNFSNATPEDVRKYLIFKEKDGKMQLHDDKCQFRTNYGLQCCLCPRTLAFKSVDYLLGKIRALFRDEWRSGEWNPMLLTANPAASNILKTHLQAVTQEQVNATVSIKQATPLMFSKLGQLCRHLSYRVFAEEDSLTRFLFARDLVYLSILCHSGSRGGNRG